MSGMREYLTGRSDGMKGAHPRKTERREPHATREDASATKHTNHEPEGTKRASGMPKHASMHELEFGMRKNILEKSETRQNNRSFHMKREQKIAHFMKNTLFFEKMRNWHPNQ